MQEDLRGFLAKEYGLSNIDIVESIRHEYLSEIQYKYRNKREALLVNQVIDFDYSFLTNILADRRVLADLLGCEVKEIHAKMLDYGNNLIEPVLVKSGRCQQIRAVGKQVDLGKLPAIQFSAEDAGQYITAGIVLARDPDDAGFQNASIHRLQLQGKNQLGIRIEDGHLLKLQKKAEERGRDLEVAIAIGVHPAELVASVSGLDFGVSEMALAGTIRGEALEQVKGITVDVDVPATADIIIEGVIPADVREIEGPFGDFQENYVDPTMNHVVIVKAITHTSDAPIFSSIRAGSYEDCLLLGLRNEVKIYEALQGKHNITGINLSPMVFNCVISVNKGTDNEPGDIIETAFLQYPWLKYCVVVDEDVDCYNIEDVWWAIGTRSNPRTGSYAIKLDTAFGRDPYDIHSGKFGIDATVPCENIHSLRRAKP